jgi:hypothetical protein
MAQSLRALGVGMLGRAAEEQVNTADIFAKVFEMKTGFVRISNCSAGRPLPSLLTLFLGDGQEIIFQRLFDCCTSGAN